MRQESLKTLRLQQALFDVFGHPIVASFHWNRAPGTTDRTLPSFRAARVVPVTAAFTRAKRHCSTAACTEADAGKERWTADDPRCGHRRTAALEQHLDDLKFILVDDCWHRHFHDFSLCLALAGLPKLGIETVPADVGRPGQHLMDRIDAPLSAVASPDADGVQVCSDGFDAHRPRASAALARQAEDQAHGLGLDGV